MQHTHRHSHGSQQQDEPASGAVLLDRGWRYDLEVWFIDTLVLRGEIGRLRRKVVDAVDPVPGKRVLDVGCGTGTLALELARRPGCRVSGIEPAPRQLERARSKARRAGLEVDFRDGAIESLPFDDGSFDAVTATLMMHHLPEETRRNGLAEIARVLTPRGRLVVADFDHSESASEPQAAGPQPDGYSTTHTLPEGIQEAGFTGLEVERFVFRRRHRGWTGASLISAPRP